ncbi:MAG: peptidylprolyl isomerase [Leptolyngbya sp. Prado105]|jgi:hypothetical protein|nr:peptidylprolyl isomerase [Leptolyngbya sp. Prado105]
MSELFPIFPNDIVQQVKLSLKLPEIMNAIVTRQIVATLAARFHIEVDPSELQQAADAFRLRHNLSTTEATLSWLEQYRLTIEDFEALIYAETLQSKLSEHLFDRQIETYFAENANDYSQAVLYKVTLPDPRTAERILRAIQANVMTFNEVVQQYTEEENRHQTGYWGTFTASEIPPELARIVFTTAPQICRSSASLIYVERLIQPELTDVLRAQILSDLFSDWARQQLDRAELRPEL